MSFGLREKLLFQWLNNEADSFRKTKQNKNPKTKNKSHMSDLYVAKYSQRS